MFVRMRCRISQALLFAGVIVGACGALGASPMPAQPDDSVLTKDIRSIIPPQNLDTPRTFPHYANLAAWEKRRAEIRRQILVSCGLDQMPPKTPLKTQITGKVVRDGYTIEKVSIQTYPGFYLCGNLYRPHGASA